MVSRRNVRGAPAGLVCPVVTDPPQVVGIASVAHGRYRAGSWRWRRSSGSGGWSRSRPARRSRPAAAAGYEPRGQQRAATLERRPGNHTSCPLHRLSAGPAIVAAMMQLDAPERDVPAGPAVLRLAPGRPAGGGRGPRRRQDHPAVAIDAPGRWSWTRSRSGTGSSAGSAGSPTGCGGRWSTPSTYLRVLVALPSPSGLIVHDTGTCGWRRRLLVGLARRCGRTGHLFLLDVTAEAALEGRRRRTLRRSSFATHWRTRPAPRRASTPTAPPRAGPRSGFFDRPAANRLQRVDIPHR